MKHWKGAVTFTGKEHKRVFSALSWVAKAASKDETRYFMRGIFNEVIDGNRVFVATDGKRLHKVEFRGKPGELSRIPEGKNLAFKAGSKEITFTEEIDGAFPNYKGVIPDITDITPFYVYVRNIKELGYTEALYEFYSRNVKMNALHVEGMNMTGDPYLTSWEIYPAGNVVVCKNSSIIDYTVVATCIRG
jgi:hypothetical protein